MSRKPSTRGKRAGKSAKVEFKGFLAVTLNKQEKQYVKDNPLDSSEITEFFRTASFYGYKISISWQQVQDCYTITAYGTRDGHDDAGYALSLRHRDFITAVTALHWCLDQAGKDGSLRAWLGEDDELDW